MGKLFLVSTPIGNLKDITYRAVEVLSKVDFIACEDTRKTGLLFQKLKIPKKGEFLSYYEENEKKRISQIIDFLKEGKNIALVSNAGTPTISDPGFKLVRECQNLGIKIEAIPGPSSVLAALVVSGLPTDKFLFLGYLPKKEGKRIRLLKNIQKIPFSCTLVIFESPLRVIRLLKELEEFFNNPEIVICNELTKMFEKVIKGKTEELIKILSSKPLKGEITVLFRILPK